MTRKTTKRGANPLFFALAGITLVLSAWGLYGLLHDYAGAPVVIAALAIGGLDLVAILLGKHALDVADDGDSPLPWNIALVFFTAVASAAQFWHGILAGWPVITGVVMAMFPLATILLFEGQLRRRYRLRARAEGRMAPPRAIYSVLTWLFYRRQALLATKLSVLDSTIDPDAALYVAEARIAADAAKPPEPPKRRVIERRYPEIEAGQPTGADARPGSQAPVSGQAPGQPGTLSGHGDTVRALRPDTARTAPGIADLVREAADQVGDDVEDITDYVLEHRPDAKEDSVRRQARRLIKPTG